MSNISQYSDTRNLKVVYYLGAGSSYYSVPIQERLGNSMIEASNQIKTILRNTDIISKERYKPLVTYKDKLNNVADGIEYFGKMAIEYGSLDIYARRLSLLDLKDELNRLKFSASIFFVFWENFLYQGQPMDKERDSFYVNIDKRYLSLLSVLLDPDQGGNPKLKDRVTFISWNYDLQLEKAYQTFMRNKANEITLINEDFTFLNTDYPNVKRDVIHLNGFSGVFADKDKEISVLSDNNMTKKEDFLINLIDNIRDWTKHSSRYDNYFKYAWENNKNREAAKKVMSEADVLVIIGYSFPAFNREIDADLIDAFKNGGSMNQVVYQDPNANQDIMDLFFGANNKNVVVQKESPKQFHIPHEFLNPQKGSTPFI